MVEIGQKNWMIISSDTQDFFETLVYVSETDFVSNFKYYFEKNLLRKPLFNYNFLAVFLTFNIIL